MQKCASLLCSPAKTKRHAQQLLRMSSLKFAANYLTVNLKVTVSPEMSCKATA